MKYDPDVWGPHYWFFLQSIAHAYPETPNSVTKRKYYDFIQNLPLFLPDSNMGDQFSKFLDKYPVTPYLDHRDSFIRWVHFIHNKYNQYLGKEEISLYDSIDRYYDEYKPKPVIISDTLHIRKHILYISLILFLIFLIYVLYR
jgi:hypothetical protein